MPQGLRRGQHGHNFRAVPLGLGAAKPKVWALETNVRGNVDAQDKAAHV